MDRRGHLGVPLPLRQLTQVTLLIRLIALAAGLLVLTGSRMTVATMLGFLVVGMTSFFGLMNTSVLRVVRQHPLIAMLDTLLLVGIVAINGIDSPLLLAALTTAFLLGLWLEPAGGAIIMVCMVGLYVTAALTGPDADQQRFTSWVGIPFVYVMLWLLGMTMRRSVESERAAQEVLHDAVVTAAATEERSRLARELHDSLAKTLQGLALTATALPLQVQRNPERAEESAIAIRSMATEAVHQVRAMMGDLRSKTSHGSLTEAVTQVVLGWATRTGRHPAMAIDEVDLEDEATRYELLAVLEEALDNVHRHAGPCDVSVGLHARDGALTLIITDDGVGFDQDQRQDAQRAGHYGVNGMQERLARVGGWCSVTSKPGSGTTVDCHVPQLDRVER